MNKDLDERLVPNGEYRDAMNVQVATSEGSEVGTIQNILGNSLVPGQGFLPVNAVCVASIADEKNDKLYYFVTQKELLSGVGSFGNNGAGWDVTSTISGYTGDQWTFSNNQAVGTSGDAGTMVASAPGVVDGNRYTITYDIVEAASSGGIILANHSFIGGIGTNGTDNNVHLANEDVIGTYTVEWEQGPSASRQNNIWLYNPDAYDGTVDNISVFISDKARSAIVEYDSNTNSITPVFIDMIGDVLRFDENNIITGVNIIDGLMFWTDNHSEPKKINISRSIQGTNSSGATHTKLVVNGEILEQDIKEENITVIKKAPSSAPSFSASTNHREGLNLKGRIKNQYHFRSNVTGELTKEGSEFWIGLATTGETNLKIGDILRVNQGTVANSEDDIDSYIARLLVKEIRQPSVNFFYPQVQNEYDDTVQIASSAQSAIRVSLATLIASNETLISGNEFYFKLEQSEEGIFERKFPRFAYRYKYEDGEYSAVGPFTPVVFIPRPFEYHPTEAYNKGMVNDLKTLELNKFSIEAEAMQDVVGIDLLYKNEFSPNVYVVKSVVKNDNIWNSGIYDITTENIYAQIPSNQLTRPWDNVPKTALAQEVTGNRVVYANYTQGYDIGQDDDGVDITPGITATLAVRNNEDGGYNKATQSIKSQRTYNVGVVYGDVYGRETPVFTTESANQLVTKASASSANALIASVTTEHPEWANYFKVYVKETANEYYNLAMGRAYDAEDGNIWISFPSIDRNKVDEDTYLILKKGIGNNLSSIAGLDARYKIVAIENEAPDYIKTEYKLLAEVQSYKALQGHILFGGKNYLVGSPAEIPRPGATSFTISKPKWTRDVAVSYQLGLLDLEKLWNEKGEADLYVSFSNIVWQQVDGATAAKSAQPVMSRKFKITTFELLPAETATDSYRGEELYRFTIAETIKQSESYLTDSVGTGDYHKDKHPSLGGGGGLTPHFYKKEVDNKPEFDGRFFVKIIEDETLREALSSEILEDDPNWIITSAINNLGYVSDSGSSISNSTTGVTASMTKAQWGNNLGSGGKWFIDAASFAGVQPSNSNHPKESITTYDGNVLVDVSSNINYAKLNLITSGDFDQWKLQIETLPLGTGGSQGAGFMRGAHEATYDTVLLQDPMADSSGYDSSGGDLYLSISHGGFGPEYNPLGYGDLPLDSWSSWYTSIPPDYTITYNSSGNSYSSFQFKAYWYRDTYWNTLNPDKNWNLPSSQSSIVASLTKNKMFRLRGNDSIYKIKSVHKRRLYNYMGNMRWDERFIIEDDMWYCGNTTPNYASLMNPSGILGYYDHNSGVYNPATGFVTSDQFGGLNSIDPEDLPDLVEAQNLVDGVSPDYAKTDIRDQHNRMMERNNTRVNYLIKYEVVGGYGDGDKINENNVFQALADLDDNCRLEFIEEFQTTTKNLLTPHPAIFETEPKEDVGLDIYYEASGRKPTTINISNIYKFIEHGAIMSVMLPGGAGTAGVFVSSIIEVYNEPNLWKINLSASNLGEFYGEPGTEIRFYNDDGSFTVTVLNEVLLPQTGYYLDNGTKFVSAGGVTYGEQTNEIIVEILPNTIGLGWFNCWSFGNGVESNRIGDTYNKPFITNGVKASATLLETYREEHRKYGLIYSGIYNSTSGVNDLNQFIAAEKITKDVNPIYGSIQKLHSRSTADGDLIALCEDRILKILANKDALFNADGNPQLIANDNVLGQTIPFSGEYGISTNPESFASESYRVYFTDRVRGTVMRLSKDGLTPISDHGMKDWFKDNLSLGVTNLLGENNLASQANWDIPSSGNSAIINGEAYLGYYNNVPKDIRFGKAAGLRMLNVMEVGKTYRVRYDVVSNAANSNGLTMQRPIAVDNRFPGGGWISAAYSNAATGTTVDKTFVANNKDFRLHLYQVNSANQAPYGVTGYSDVYDIDGNLITALSQWVTDQGYEENWTGSYFYGGAATIKNIILEEVKEGLKIIGSYDDNKDEYNLTIDGETSNTISFREDVRGWISFKSFAPENAISCANDYYTMKSGRLWQHHNPGVNRNTFYGEFSNSSFNVLLNDMPGSIKSYHALGYEGSQSKVDGVKTVEITGINHNSVSVDGLYAFFEASEMSSMINDGLAGWNSSVFSIKQYRNNALVYDGMAKSWSNINSNSLTSPSGGPTKGHLRKHPYDNSTSNIAFAGDFQVGDIISTKLQEDSISYFNSFSKDGWHVSSIETDKEKGSLIEFIEKEGKWFNYVSGAEQTVDSDFDFGSFDTQGLGIIEDIDNNNLTVSGSLNVSLQVGDTIYYELPSQGLGSNLLQGVADTDWSVTGGSGVQWSVNSGVFQAGTYPDYGYISTNVPSIIEGGEYELRYEVIDPGSYGQFILANHGVNNSNVYLEESVGNHAVRWVQGSSNVGEINLYNDSAFEGAITNLSVRQVNISSVVGFTRIESNELQKAGLVTAINGSVITVDDSGTLPLKNNYCMFIKNQVVNTSGLSGYYASAKFENNSKIKAELFSVSSEISESSK